MTVPHNPTSLSWREEQWTIYGDGDGAFAIAYVSPTSFSVTGADVTTVYHAGRRVKATGPLTGTIYGTIGSAAFATNTTVTVRGTPARCRTRR